MRKILAKIKSRFKGKFLAKILAKNFLLGYEGEKLVHARELAVLRDKMATDLEQKREEWAKAEPCSPIFYSIGAIE